MSVDMTDWAQEQAAELQSIARQGGGTGAIIIAAIDGGRARMASWEEIYRAMALALARQGAEMERMLVEQTMLRPPPDIVVHDPDGSIRLRYAGGGSKP